MRLVTIDYESTVLPETERTPSSSASDAAFNTSFHTPSEAPNEPGKPPSERPYSFRRWLPLILRTRRRSGGGAGGSPPPPSSSSVPAVQTTVLSRAQARLLLDAAEASIPRGDGTLNRLYAEDVEASIVAPMRAALQFPPEGLWVRLAACSPKDGVIPPQAAVGGEDGGGSGRGRGRGRQALRCAEDVVLKIATSARARNAIRVALEEEDGDGDRVKDGNNEAVVHGGDEKKTGGGEEEKGVQKGRGRRGEKGGERGRGTFEIPLFFLPFDSRMDSASEYRVFCPPGGEKITGISQYQWHKPWEFGPALRSDARHEGEAATVAETIAVRIWDCAEGIRQLVMAELSGEKGGGGALHDDGNADDDDDALFRRQGFSFDVLFDAAKNDCELIELNGFGARSSCGSCLFHWVRDRDVLWGAEGVEPEFRVAV